LSQCCVQAAGHGILDNAGAAWKERAYFDRNGAAVRVWTDHAQVEVDWAGAEGEDRRSVSQQGGDPARAIVDPLDREELAFVKAEDLGDMASLFRRRRATMD
jgi:hypothetical protein